MIKGKYTFFDSEEAKVAYNIRKKVFKDLALPDKDEIDSISVHGIAYFEETIPVAAGRITYIGGKYVMSRIAVLPDFQRKKIGDFLVRMLVDKAFSAGAKEVYTDSPVDIVPFFKTIGFNECSDVYTLNDIKYQPLCLKLKNFRTGCGHTYCPELKK